MQGLRVSRNRDITINIRKDLHEQTATFRRPKRQLDSLRDRLLAASPTIASLITFQMLTFSKLKSRI